jgi:hypothetical protein
VEAGLGGLGAGGALRARRCQWQAAPPAVRATPGHTAQRRCLLLPGNQPDLQRQPPQRPCALRWPRRCPPRPRRRVALQAVRHRPSRPAAAAVRPGPCRPSCRRPSCPPLQAVRGKAGELGIHAVGPAGCDGATCPSKPHTGGTPPSPQQQHRSQPFVLRRRLTHGGLVRAEVVVREVAVGIDHAGPGHRLAEEVYGLLGRHRGVRSLIALLAHVQRQRGALHAVLLLPRLASGGGRGGHRARLLLLALGGSAGRHRCCCWSRVRAGSVGAQVAALQLGSRRGNVRDGYCGSVGIGMHAGGATGALSTPSRLLGACLTCRRSHHVHISLQPQLSTSPA